MILNNLFESRYGAAAGVETIRQLIHAVKDSKDIDLKVGPEQFPVSYGDARYLLQYWKANREGGDATAEYFGDANWIEAKLAKRDTVQSPDRLKQFDKERFAESDYKGWKYSSYDEDYGDNRKTSHVATKDGKEVDIDWSPYNRMSDEQFKTWVDLGMPTRKDVDSIGPLQPEDLEALMKTKLGTRARLAQEGEDTEEKCDCCGNEIVNGECGCGPECPHCGGKPHTKESEVNEASFEITYNDPQFSKPRTHTVKAVNAKSAEQKFLSFGNPYKILDIKKAEKVNEGTWHIPDTPELVQGLNKWFKQDRPVGKNAELIQKSLGQFIGDDALYDDLEAVAQVNPNIDGRSLVMTWINDHMPEIADAMKGEKGFVMYEGEELGEYDSHNVGKGQYSDFEIMRAIKVAQDYHDDMTHAIEKIDAIKPGLSNHRAVKDELRRQNEGKDDITKKLDPKTRVALKKQQMKTAGVTKGDPIAAMAMGLEKDVDRLDKENDEEEADIASQELVDKYHSQELDKIRKMLDTLLKR